MDRLEFSKSVDFGVDADFLKEKMGECMPGIVKFFDQTMGLYNIIGDKKCVVYATSPDSISVAFSVTMSNEEDARALKTDLDNMDTMIMYGMAYRVESAMLVGSVVTTVIKIPMQVEVGTVWKD